MSTPTLHARLRSGTSVLAISAIALIGAATLQPALAGNTFTNGLYGGGSTLASLSARQILDCYMGATIGTGTPGNLGGADGNSFSASFPGPQLLPATCTAVAASVEGLYAGVGSGGGLRGFLSNNPVELFGGSPPGSPSDP